MMKLRSFLIKQLKALLLLAALPFVSVELAAHGGVAFEDDLCVINIDFMQKYCLLLDKDKLHTALSCLIKKRSV